MIPKIIHICWLSKEPYPERVQQCIDSWKQKLQGYRIMLWDINMFDINMIPWTKQAYENKKFAFAADYIRFYALYNYGGIYLDSDVEVVKGFDELLDQKYFFGYEYTGVPEAAVVGAQKGCEWIKICKEWYETREYIDYLNSGKSIIAPLILQYGYEKYNNIELIDYGNIKKQGGGTIYPYYYFSPKNGFTGEIIKNDKTYTVHHFNSAWLNTSSWKLKMKRDIHMLLIRVIGKKRYNILLYKLRKSIHELN